jgi:hypothetical protein
MGRLAQAPSAVPSICRCRGSVRGRPPRSHASPFSPYGSPSGRIPARSIRIIWSIHQCILCTEQMSAVCFGFRSYVVHRVANVWHQHGHVIVDDGHVQADPLQGQYMRSPDRPSSHLEFYECPPPQSQAPCKFLLCQLPFVSEDDEFICFHGAIVSVLKHHVGYRFRDKRSES